MRVIIYVPIVHSEADLGSLLGDVKRGFLEAFGEEAWTRRSAAVDAMWVGLANRLAAMPLVWSDVRLYQDGLPVCGREMDIVSEVAAQGSRNHRLLLDLVGQGATLMGTEDPQLMIREYRRTQALALAATETMPASRFEELKRDGTVILAERDAFIARRIEETLLKGETGIAFMGMLHRVNEKISGDIQIQPLIYSLPFGTGPNQERTGKHNED